MLVIVLQRLVDVHEYPSMQVVNHGIPENLISALFNVCNEFFDMPEKEKLQFENKHPLYPVMVRSGTIDGNDCNQKVKLWRDYLRFFVHPEYHCPTKPKALR